VKTHTLKSIFPAFISRTALSTSKVTVPIFALLMWLERSFQPLYSVTAVYDQAPDLISRDILNELPR